MAWSISYHAAGGKSGVVRRGGVDALRHNYLLNPSPRQHLSDVPSSHSCCMLNARAGLSPALGLWSLLGEYN